MNEETLFHVALEKPASERAAFLAEACAGDAALRQRVEILLHAHAHPGSFLQQPSAAIAATIDEPIQERPGTVIGPYKLFQQIADGGKPVPKVIGFGVAKATEQKLTERTLFTQYGTMVGTLEYMSPEQAEMSALGVDTRSDISSLGVLLYELLTGSTPLTHKRMKEAAYAEILRMIKEEEPPKPSTRLSDSGEALASISAQRHMEPAKLTKLVRGELDWIVMKTLEKDRNRRYETASGFAADVQRYLNDETVQASPPSAGYRFRKFARRNKRTLVTAALFGIMLLAAVGALTGTVGRAVRHRRGRQQEPARKAGRGPVPTEHGAAQA